MVKRVLIITILYSFFCLIFLKTAWGQEKIAGESAQIASSSSEIERKQPRFDFRPLKLRKFLFSKKSILENHVVTLINIADKNKVDYRLFPSIAGVESGFCKAYIVTTNNCVGWGGGYIQFKSIEEQIEKVLTTLKEKYIDDGLVTVDQIGKRYAEDPTWSFKVKRNMEEIEKTSIL